MTMNSVIIVISKRVHSQIMYASKDRQSKGTVSVEVFQGRLRLRLPRQLFDGKQKYLTLGLSDTKINLKIVEAKAQETQTDIVLEQFDYALDKYRPTHLKLVDYES